VEVNYSWWGWVIAYYFVAIFIVIKLQKSELLKNEINGKI
jgi:hypothetical protein